jgi:hypothetical protein
LFDLDHAVVLSSFGLDVSWSDKWMKRAGIGYLQGAVQPFRPAHLSR